MGGGGKCTGETVDSYLSSKSGINLFDGCRENASYGRTVTTDARATILAPLTQSSS